MNKKKIIDNLQKSWTDSVVPSAIIDAMAEGILPLFPKFEQIAFYAPQPEAMKRMYRHLGCSNWIDDTVTAKGIVGDGKTETINVADLSFNYDLGIELELIRYRAGPNWHQLRDAVDNYGDCVAPFLSHMSYHVEDMAAEKARFNTYGFKVIQDVRTISHTNPALTASGQKYRYVIFDTSRALGFDIKLIKRLPLAEGR